VRGYPHDKISVEGGADPFQHPDGGYHAACFQAGKRGLGHVRPDGEFGLGQPQGKALLADGRADQERLAGFCITLVVLLAAAALAGKIFVG